MAQLFATEIYTTIWTLPSRRADNIMIERWFRSFRYEEAYYRGWSIKTKINEAINYF